MSPYARDVAMKLARAFTIVALCASLGLHWFALQSVAWTIMIVEYSKQAPLRAAISQTFDGQHPCSLCHAVQKGKTKKSDIQSATQKVDLICATRPIGLIPPAKFWDYGTRSFGVFRRGQSPPVPPPRIAPV
ncbi:MAG: hypothetical protein M3O66_02730 [Verrucomicrobiota bacterium]|nr:hypothetical protein [Verrucomicrobiota bacterium]